MSCEALPNRSLESSTWYSGCTLKRSQFPNSLLDEYVLGQPEAAGGWGCSNQWIVECHYVEASTNSTHRACTAGKNAAFLAPLPAHATANTARSGIATKSAPASGCCSSTHISVYYVQWCSLLLCCPHASLVLTDKRKETAVLDFLPLLHSNEFTNSNCCQSHLSPRQTDSSATTEPSRDLR